MKWRKGVFFFKRIAGTFGLFSNPGDDFFWVDFVHQFGMVKSLHLIFLRVLGGWCMTEFQKQQVPCIDFTTIFTQTYLLVVEIITYKKTSIQGNHQKTPPKNNHM